MWCYTGGLVGLVACLGLLAYIESLEWAPPRIGSLVNPFTLKTYFNRITESLHS